MYLLIQTHGVNPLIGTLKPHSNGPLCSNTVIGTLAVNGCYIWYSQEGPGRAASRAVPSSLYWRFQSLSPYDDTESGEMVSTTFSGLQAQPFFIAKVVCISYYNFRRIERHDRSRATMLVAIRKQQLIAFLRRDINITRRYWLHEHYSGNCINLVDWIFVVAAETLLYRLIKKRPAILLEHWTGL